MTEADSDSDTENHRPEQAPPAEKKRAVLNSTGLSESEFEAFAFRSLAEGLLRDSTVESSASDYLDNVIEESYNSALSLDADLPDTLAEPGGVANTDTRLNTANDLAVSSRASVAVLPYAIAETVVGTLDNAVDSHRTATVNAAKAALEGDTNSTARVNSDHVPTFRGYGEPDYSVPIEDSDVPSGGVDDADGGKED